MVQTIQQTTEFPLSYVFGGRCPCFQVEQVLRAFPSPVNTVVDVPIVQVVLAIPVVRRQVRKAQTLQNSVEVPQLQFIKFVDFSCRGAEADSHGPCDHGDSTVAVH